MTEASLISLGRCYAELFMIRQVASQFSGCEFMEVKHSEQVAHIAAIANGLIAHLMHCHHMAKKGGEA